MSETTFAEYKTANPDAKLDKRIGRVLGLDLETNRFVIEVFRGRPLGMSDNVGITDCNAVNPLTGKDTNILRSNLVTASETIGNISIVTFGQRVLVHGQYRNVTALPEVGSDVY